MQVSGKENSEHFFAYDLLYDLVFFFLVQKHLYDQKRPYLNHCSERTALSEAVLETASESF